MAEQSDDATARLEQYKRHFDSEAEKAEKLAAEAKAINANIEAQRSRIKQGLPSPDSCVDCWVKDGVESRFVSRRADDPANFDRWACPRCGWYKDVNAWR